MDSQERRLRVGAQVDVGETAMLETRIFLIPPSPQCSDVYIEGDEDPIGMVFRNDNAMWSARSYSDRANHGDWYLGPWEAAKQLALGLRRE